MVLQIWFTWVLEDKRILVDNGQISILDHNKHLGQ